MPIDPTDPELDYRAANYQDFEAVDRKQIACATCGTNLSSKLEKSGGVFVHPFMTTLQCKKCSVFYGDGDFSMDEDGEDKYCRMCGNGGELYLCGNKPCPYGFCQKCIKRYLGKNSSEVEADDWKCLHCNCKPLWEVRAVCAAVLLERSKIRRKHKKTPTSGEVRLSDDDCSRSEELDGDSERCKQVNLRHSRFKRNSNRDKKVVNRLDKTADDSNDSRDSSDPHSEVLVGKKHTNAKRRNRCIESDAEPSSVLKTNSAGLSKGEKRLGRKLASGKDGFSVSEEKRMVFKTRSRSKFDIAAARVESKSPAKQNDRSSSHTWEHRRKIVLSKKPKSPENSINPTNDSDSDTSHDSAKDFVEYKKKKDSKTRKEKPKERNFTVRKKISNNSESSNSKADLNPFNAKSDDVAKDRKTLELSSGSKDTKNTGTSQNQSSKNLSLSSTSKRIRKSKVDNSKSDEETDYSNRRSSKNKKSPFGETKISNHRNNSENEGDEKDEENEGDEKDEENEGDEKDEENEGDEKDEENESDEKDEENEGDEKDEENEGDEKDEENESDEKDEENEGDENHEIDPKSKPATQSKRLSNKLLSRRSQRSSLLDYNIEALDRKKASIKLSYAKCASTQDDVTERQAALIKNHVDELLYEMKMFGKSLSTAVKGIATKHSLSNATSVAAVSKTVLKCALLMIRCEEGLAVMEQNFTKSYEKWCQSSKVQSIFSAVENIDPDTGDEVESMIVEETPANISRNEKLEQDSNAERTEKHAADNSVTSNVDKNNEQCNHLAPNVSVPTIETDDEHSDVEQTAVNSCKNSSHSKSTEEIKNSVREDKDSDSDRESSNPKKISDNISDCDRSEIFSEDESTAQANKAEKPGNKIIRGESQLSNTSRKRSIESNFDRSGKVTPQKSKGIEEESLQSDNIVESPSKTPQTHEQFNNEEYTEPTMEDSPEKSSRVHSCIENTDLNLNLSVENILNDTKSTTPNKESDCASNSDQSIANCSAGTEILCRTKNDVQSSDEDATIELCEKFSASRRNLSHTSTNDTKQKTSVDESPITANENMDELSDCDASMIFTQLPGHILTSNLNANHIPESPAPVETARDSEETYMSDLEIDDIDMPLENDDTDKDKVVTPLKETSDLPETIAEQHKGIADSDNDEDREGESNDLQTCEESRKGEKVDDTCTAAQLSVDGENNYKESTAAVEEDETNETEEKRATTFDSDSEEAIKKKILESDSELSDVSIAVSTRSDSLEPRVNSDSEKYEKEPVSADPTANIATSDPSDISEKSVDFKIKDKACEINSMSPRSTDVEVSELNNLAKHRLLSSSSDSDSDVPSLTLASNVDNLDSHSSSPQKNNETVSNSINEKRSRNFTNSGPKKKKFNLEKNYYYKTDKKLQMICQVVVRKLNETVLDQFRQLLGESKERQEWKDFRSLVDLNNIKKGKRGTRESNQSEESSDSTSSISSSKGHTKKKSKQVQEKEETLLEHLEKMQNGESYCNLSGNDTDENNDILKNLLPEENAEEEFLSKANKLAKDLLIQSSDSENEMDTLIGNNGEKEEETEIETKKERKKDKDIPNDEHKEAVDSGSNHENGSNADQGDEDAENDEEKIDTKESEGSDSDRTREKKKMKEGLSKRNWRLTDSDTSSDERKWQKSQLAKSDDKSAVPTDDEESKVKENRKRKKNVKRRVLGSDSDSVKLTDQSDSSVELLDGKKSLPSDSEDSSELFKNLRKKRKRKRNAANKSDSASESEQEEKTSKLKRKRIKKMESDSDSDDDNLTNSQDTPGKLHRKNIRKVLKDKQVADVTKIAGKEEEERLRRIAERQKLYNEMYEMKLASEAKVDKLILDFDEETKKELISVHEDLVKRLKPHQAQGIKFMWDACFESLERTKSTTGSGCIVAHCMGLGKTFQVVTLAHTLLTHSETGIKTIMVICPLSTVLNWVNEFKKWLGDINNGKDVKVFEMTKLKKNFERKCELQKWYRAGGVMVLGYEMFRLLSNQTGKKMRKSLHEEILKCLVNPGPDLIVCDEGHLLKNEDTALSKAMRKVKTLRRVVLTGTPLQNNLVEYHCMVQFVKPNLLGTKKEFLNRFVNPITNGQFDDSTEYDVKLMKKRAHVLHKMLEGSVQRFDYSVLTPFLPPKQEYVITVRLTDIQIKLYQHYLDHFSRKKVGAGTSLFADFQSLQRIWTHPIVLRMNAEKMEKLNEKRRMDTSDSEGSLRDFLDDGSDEKSTTSEDSDVQSASGSSDEKTDKPKRGTRANPIDPESVKEEEEELPQAGEWWSQFVEPEHLEDMKVSSKLVLLFAILKECEQIGDKVLVFSQSLYALSLIEEFLNKIDDETQSGTCSDFIDSHTGSWSLGLDYFRLDGQTAPEHRSHYCKIFNNPRNSRARLFLISTRAGGLGINLTAANRVIIFDASWNPSHDVQSIFRIYRFGQKKPCYVYRFLAQGTMEEKIYNRQVTKLSLSCRVVDEQQIERHYSNHDLAELYQFEPNTSKEKPTLNLPKDRLLAEIFRKYEDRIETFHEHDSLLENKAEEELDEEERKEAWKEYEDERTGRKVYLNNFSNQNFAMQQYNDMMNMNQADIANRASLSGINIETLQALIQKDYPNSTPEQQKMMTQRAIMDMYTYMENEAIRQQQIAAAASSFNYPTMSNLGTSSFVDKNVMTPVQRQYALQQQQQMHQMMVQREQQANYAKRFGNVRGTGLSVTATRPPPVVQIEDNDIIEVPPTPPATAGPAASSSVQASSAAAPATAENSKRQEE